MPTTRPRITITLTEHQHEVLNRMAVLGKGSMSAIVTDMVETMLPVLERVVNAMQAAHDAPKELHKGMLQSLEKAEKDMEPLLAQTMAQLDILEELSSVRDAKQHVAPAVGSKSDKPPSTNRGVRKPPQITPERALARVSSDLPKRRKS